MFDWQIPGYDLTSNELLMEELERPSSRLSLLLEEAADRAPAVTGAPGADRLSRLNPAGGTPMPPDPAGPTSTDAA